MSASLPARLQGLSRFAKFILVLTAAWAPLLLAGQPWLAASVVLGATVLFFIAAAKLVPEAASNPEGDIHEGG